MSKARRATKAQQWAIAQAIDKWPSGNMRSFDRQAEGITNATVSAMEKRGWVRVFWSEYGHWSAFLVLPEGRAAAKAELDRREEQARASIERQKAEELEQFGEEP